MTITITRLGGFAGVEERLASADLQKLPAPVADLVQTRLARLDALPVQGQEGADQFRYAIELAQPGRAPRTITVVDEGDPEQPAMMEVRAILGLLGVHL